MSMRCKSIHGSYLLAFKWLNMPVKVPSSWSILNKLKNRMHKSDSYKPTKIRIEGHIKVGIALGNNSLYLFCGFVGK